MLPHVLRFAAALTTRRFADRDSFVCVGTYDRKSGKIAAAPEEYAAPSNAAVLAADSGKGRGGRCGHAGKGKSAATAAPAAASR